jgi:pimeloyl-ACP methyl ester carboxylesterase
MIDARFHSSQTQGQSIRYRIIGKGKRILFLHGAWVDPFIFAELFEELSGSYELLIPDIPPFGESRSTTVLSLPLYAKLFDELLGSIGWSHVTVIGHSFGGGIGLHLASRSSNIEKLIVCNPIGIPFRRAEILMKYPFMVYRALANLAKQNGHILIKKLLSDVSHVLQHNPVRPIAQTITQCFLEEEKIFSHIQIPVYVLWGRPDEMLPASYIERMEKLIPQISIQFIEGHHNWCLVDQKKTANYINLILK